MCVVFVFPQVNLLIKNQTSAHVSIGEIYINTPPRGNEP